MSSVEAIVDVEKFSKWIELQTRSSKECLNNQLQAWSSDPQKLSSLSARFNRFKKEFDRDSKFFDKSKKLFSEIAECEMEIEQLTTTTSELEKESYNEILFFKPVLQPLNFIPYLLTIWSVIRVYVLPGLSFLIPFITLIAPYIIIRFIFNRPISLERYVNILQSITTGSIDKLTDPNSITPVSPANLLKQFGIFLFTFIQGVIQPYWSYKHLKSIDNIITDKGTLVIRFRDTYNKLHGLLGEHGFDFFKCPLPEIKSSRDATAQAILRSSYFKLALKYVGSLEVIMCLAHKSDINAVCWVKSDKPVFRAKDTYDFQVENRKTITANFDNQQHALLTGPNKGGKSTVLRALSMSALLAHTYGCSLGNLTATPFSKMFVCLKPDDLPGSKSRFEREIEFTANTLKCDTPTLIFIDELYHSTNPPDALRSCEIYCKQLWNKANIVSVISTHLFELVENAEVNIQRLCCPATIDEKGDIHFEYSLQNGICKVSSVDELLKRNGLMNQTECA